MESALKINYLKVRQQSNIIDCGIFAIAFAVVCVGLPTNESCYDNIEMRSHHLSTCLQLQEDFKEGSLRVQYIDIFYRIVLVPVSANM